MKQEATYLRAPGAQSQPGGYSDVTVAAQLLNRLRTGHGALLFESTGNSFAACAFGWRLILPV